MNNSMKRDFLKIFIIKIKYIVWNNFIVNELQIICSDLFNFI